MATNPNATYAEVLHWASSFLKTAGREAFASERLLLDQLNWDKTTLILHLKEIMPSKEKKRYEEGILAHSKGRPIQHLTGFEKFYGLSFKVTTDTLIPRPETEEVVARILDEISHLKEPSILDVGTGTGIIGLTLKKIRPDAKVTVTDISPEALAVAKYNGQRLDLDVTYLEGDLFEPVKGRTFDVIVSNPPYIPHSDQHLMDDTVLQHEPHLALFASHNGLALYERFAQELSTKLNSNGLAVFEIGYNQGESVQILMEQALPKANVWYEKDLAGNDRIVFVQL